MIADPTILQAISVVGFPIVIALLFFWDRVKITVKLINIIEANTESIKLNTVATNLLIRRVEYQDRARERAVEKVINEVRHQKTRS